MRGTSGLCAEQMGINLSYMPRQYSSMWKIPPPGWTDMQDEACAKIPAASMPPIFFRADNIGAGGQAFDSLCRLFRHYEVPLAMAVVPAWLSDARQERLFRTAPMEEGIWDWHQHGWRHVNWQKNGYRSEFGSNRPAESQNEDILQGMLKMERVFGHHFIPVFTPPWGHLSPVTVKILRKLNFKGVSSASSLPQGLKLPQACRNLPARLDLHLHESAFPPMDIPRLMARFSQLTTFKEPCGIVVHHQRMTPFAFEFLDRLLYNLTYVLKARFCSLRELVDGSHEKSAGARLR